MGKVKPRLLGDENIEEKQKKKQKAKSMEKKMIKKKEQMNAEPASAPIESGLRRDKEKPFTRRSLGEGGPKTPKSSKVVNVKSRGKHYQEAKKKGGCN